jgi:hypothetical protein
MKPILMICLLFSCVVYGQLPPSLFGRYGGEMPAYEVNINENLTQIDAHDVFVTISEDELTYKGGGLILNGEYVVFKESNTNYIVSVNLSNGKSLSYDADFTIDKKAKTLKIPAKNGQSEAVLELISN